MALKLNERYPGRFDNPTPGFPQGAFKNRTSPTAKDGSYLEKDWANDKEGFFQSLIAAAGIVPNGLVDAVGSSQYFDALKKVATGRLLRTTVYAIVGGVQMVSVDGGTPTATGATTFTALALTAAVRIQCQGAGGGSGGSAATGAGTLSVGGGGGAGAYAAGWFTAAFSGLTVTVGIGGTAGPAGSGSGGTGGTTSVGALVSCPGGGGSLSSSTASASAGVFGGVGLSSPPTGGNVLSIRGGGGLYGIQWAGISSNAAGGLGGASVFGPGAIPGSPGVTNVGAAGTNPGAGAAGAQSNVSSAAQVGGVGADGIVIVEEFA